MRFPLASLSVFLIAASTASAETALEALRVLPPEQSRNVALVAAREGAPEPDRWHIIVFDPTSDTGLRECVVAGGRRVANRPVSQFIEKLSQSDVLGADAIKVDSDRVIKTALQYGMVNNKTIALWHFDLRKNPADGTPLWTVMCTDLRGTEMGRIIISATKGDVLSHPGFAVEPRTESVAERPAATPAPPAEPVETGNQIARKTSVPRKTATPLPLSTPKPPLLRRLFGGGNPR